MEDESTPSGMKSIGDKIRQLIESWNLGAQLEDKVDVGLSDQVYYFFRDGMAEVNDVSEAILRGTKESIENMNSEKEEELD